MNTIDFDSRRRERQFERRLGEVDRMVHLEQHELFDEWIAKEEAELTDEKIASCLSYIHFLDGIERDPTAVFEEVIFLDPDDFIFTHKIDWLEALEAALTYYAITRKFKRDVYEFHLTTHPFIGSV